MKNIVVILLFTAFGFTLSFCDNIFNSSKDDDNYNTALEQLEEEVNVSKSRRMDLVRGIIKANENYT